MANLTLQKQLSQAILKTSRSIIRDRLNDAEAMANGVYEPLIAEAPPEYYNRTLHKHMWAESKRILAQKLYKKNKEIEKNKDV